MARTIGKKNRTLVKKLTLQAIKSEVDNIENYVIERLSGDLWDIWESADSEIRRIIGDEIFK